MSIFTIDSTRQWIALLIMSAISTAVMAWWSQQSPIVRNALQNVYGVGVEESAAETAFKIFMGFFWCGAVAGALCFGINIAAVVLALQGNPLKVSSVLAIAELAVATGALFGLYLMPVLDSEEDDFSDDDLMGA